MNIVTEDITVKKEVLTLTNQRAIYWRTQDALILSDIHIGKTAHFRRHGIPMPDDILQKDLERLKKLINHFHVRKLLIVGDLFHAETNSDMATFKLWLIQFKHLSLVLIKGNHDRQSQQSMAALDIEVVTKLIIKPITFIHDYVENNSVSFIISGHIHPGIVIKGKGKQKLKLPCYQITNRQIILPAFSLFTGLNTNPKLENVTCYAFTDSSIFKF